MRLPLFGLCAVVLLQQVSSELVDCDLKEFLLSVSMTVTLLSLLLVISLICNYQLLTMNY